MYIRFWKGVHPSRKLTRDPQIWRRYLSWWLYSNLNRLPGGEPRWLSKLAGTLMPRKVVIQHAGQETTIRLPLSAEEEARSGMPEGWARLWLFWHHKLRPWFRVKLKPLESPNAHRCEFTDPVGGLLYGGSSTAMNEMFTEFIDKIEPSEDMKAEVAFAVDDLRRRFTATAEDEQIN